MPSPSSRWARTAYTDAMGEDRVLVLSFDGPVSADDISVEILDRTID